MFRLAGNKRWRSVNPIKKVSRPRLLRQIYNSKSEYYVIKILLKVFNLKKKEVEINAQPGFLKRLNEHGNWSHLELDCYIKDRKLAIEYDGEQHYEYPNIFHKTREEFDRQQSNDREKDSLCKERGVHLIRIKYLDNHYQGILRRFHEEGIIEIDAELKAEIYPVSKE